MSSLLALPVLAPIACAALAIVARDRPAAPFALGIGGATALLASACACLAIALGDGTFALQLGGWPASFGIVLVGDVLSTTMAVVTGAVGLAAMLYARASDDLAPERAPFFVPLLLLVLAGVSGAFLTGDLFNLYVWFEVMILGSFGLLALRRRGGALEGATKYVVLNVIGTTLLLLAIALAYGVTGTLSLAELSVRMPPREASAVPTAIAALFVVAFGLKAAVFPLYSWLPPAYPTASFAVAAALAGLLTKVGVYGLYRVLTLVFPTHLEVLAPWIGAIAALTMLSGVLGAVAASEIRSILSFHIVSQIGYMVMVLAFASPVALAGGVFYVVHHIVVKTNLFLVSGLLARAAGTSELARTGGLLLGRHAGLAALFAIPAASLAGIPPLSGFWAKLMVIRAGLDAGEYALVAIALVTGALTLYSMTKIWQGAFWGEARAVPVEERDPTAAPPPAASAWSHAPVIALALVTLAIGLWPAPLVALAERAGAQLSDPSEYVDAVLGEEP